MPKKNYQTPKLTRLSPQAAIKILKDAAATGDKTAQGMIERIRRSLKLIGHPPK
jgi:hypothetical protein